MDKPLTPRLTWIVQPRTLSAPAVRVAHIHSATGIYGAERWTLTVLRHHDKARVDASLVSIGSKLGAKELAAFGESFGLSVRHFDSRGRLSLRLMRTLRQFLVRSGVEIVHTHGFKSDVVAYLATLGLPIRLVSTTHGWCAGESLQIRLYEAIGRLALKRFDRVYPVSSPQARELEARFGFDASRVRLLRNAVDTSMFDECFASRRPRAHEEPLQVLFAGRLCKPKGILDLIHAFARVRVEAGAFLTLAGDGPARRETEELGKSLGMGDRITFAGTVQDIRPLLKHSHVVVLPSYSEGLPRILMESCAAGVPVVGSDIPGIRELIREGHTGRLAPAGDVAALAGAIERTAGDPDGAHQMAVNGRSLVLSSFSVERLRRELEEDYERLAHRHRPDTISPMPVAS